MDLESSNERTPLLGPSSTPGYGSEPRGGNGLESGSGNGPEPQKRCGICNASQVVGLLLMSIIGFGAFFCFDNPGALQTQLISELDLSTSDFASLYAAYSWPNVVLPVLGGFLIDKLLGVRKGTIVFASLILLGQLVLSLGGFEKSLWVMVLGRFIFGLGGECLNMALNTYTVEWFKGDQLNMVFGFQLSIARVGSTLNFLVMGPLYQTIKSNKGEDVALGLSLFGASSFTLMSFLCSFLLGWLDRRRRKVGQTEAIPVEETIKLSDIRRLPSTFWLLCLATMTYYGTIFPFISLAQDFFRRTYHFRVEEANFITGLVYLVSAVASPVFGFLIDRTGRNICWVLLAVAISLFCHCLLCISWFSPYIPMVLLGLAYSILASALWSLVSLIVDEAQLATAFGIMQALQNLGTALITMGAGSIVDKFGYTWLEVFFTGWLSVAFVSSVLIFLVDTYTTKYLNLSTQQRKNRDRENGNNNKFISISEDEFVRAIIQEQNTGEPFPSTVRAL